MSVILRYVGPHQPKDLHEVDKDKAIGLLKTGNYVLVNGSIDDDEDFDKYDKALATKISKGQVKK